MEASPGLVRFARSLARDVRMYTGDVRKQLASYRIPPGLLAAVTAEAAERGETVTDMVIRGMEAYIQRGEAAVSVPVAPVAESPVYTVPETLEPACKHPAELVEAGECRLCGADVW